ncbi:MAG: hypothetical protein HKN46_02295 [Acidimicrobiia bacterium]|nr:hypothetical protein [Acidimicrobiia bacterium]
MTDLTGYTVDDLRRMAARAGIEGRSKMRKADLIAALEVLATEPDAPWGHFLDLDGQCIERLPNGTRCDLPPTKGAVRCVLHGDIDVGDVTIPALGRLGPDTWPTLRRHQRLASYDPDPLGADPVTSEMLWWMLDYLYRDWFKVVVEGIEHVPMEGPGLLVPNHAGAALPYDAFMLQLAVANEAPLPRRVRTIGTELFNMLPFASHLFRRSGGAYASAEEANWILDHGHLLGVFPEGVAGFQKAGQGSYQTVRFGRGGFAATASAHRAPIVPVAIVGSEETHPVLFTSSRLASLVRFFLPEQRVDEMAVWLNPIPLPVAWRIRFLPPIHVPPDADRLTVLECAEATREAVQHALDEMVAER